MPSQASLKLMSGALWGVWGSSGGLRGQESIALHHIIRKAGNICPETTLGKEMGRRCLCALTVCDQKKKEEFISTSLVLSLVEGRPGKYLQSPE